MKKLYLADGHAVKEMLKIASLLHEALKMKQTGDEEVYSLTNVDLSAKVCEQLINYLDFWIKFVCGLKIFHFIFLDTRTKADQRIGSSNNT